MVKLRSPIVFEEEKSNPRVEDVLILLAGGSLLLASVAFPGLPLAFRSRLKRNWKENGNRNWDKFNLWKLRSELKRLKKQKDVEIVVEDDLPVVKLTDKGRLKVLKYDIEKLVLDTETKWDKKWRLIIYDVPKGKNEARYAFRRILKDLKLYPLQKSVYLTPYPCENQILFLREFFGIGEAVKVLIVQKLEEEEAYRKYFGI